MLPLNVDKILCFEGKKLAEIQAVKGGKTKLLHDNIYFQPQFQAVAAP